MYVEYSSNNSGGSWWLTEKHWKALEAAGWVVAWHDPFLGAKATEAKRYGLHLREAADEWESVTGLSATEPGCPCCGQPHNFTEYDDNDKCVKSGPSTSYTASW